MQILYNSGNRFYVITTLASCKYPFGRTFCAVRAMHDILARFMHVRLRAMDKEIQAEATAHGSL